MAEPLIPKHGGYRNLKSFQVARLVYDVTVDFVDRFVDPKSRTRDQMVQAARSGVQNIAEGSQASGTSKKMELKLTNVARASLEELKLDYEDFLRHRGLAAWRRDDPRRQRLIDSRPVSLEDVVNWMEEASGAPGEPSTASTQSTSAPWEAEALCNGALALIAVASALLDRQIAAQAARLRRTVASPSASTASVAPSVTGVATDTHRRTNNGNHKWRTSPKQIFRLHRADQHPAGCVGVIIPLTSPAAAGISPPVQSALTWVKRR